MVFQLTVGTLREQIASKVQIPVSDACLKFHKNEITANQSIQRTLSDVGIQKNGDVVFLEKMDVTPDLARPWVIHIKTLTGKMFNIEVSNPQVGLVKFLSLSHSHAHPPDAHTHTRTHTHTHTHAHTHVLSGLALISVK